MMLVKVYNIPTGQVYLLTNPFIPNLFYKVDSSLCLAHIKMCKIRLKNEN